MANRLNRIRRGKKNGKHGTRVNVSDGGPHERIP